MFSKIGTKKYMIIIALFIVGMLCVSISNMFGGYYSSVAVIETILFTIYLYDLFEKKESLKSNIVEIILCSTITFFGIVFFVVNDIFNSAVYVKNSIGFWGFCVIFSQLISMGSIMFVLANSVITLDKNNVEVIEEEKKQVFDKADDSEDIKVETKKDIEQNETIEVKSLINNKIQTDVPFMEEEK